MSKELSVPFMSVTGARPANWLRTAGVVLAASALLAVCSHIALPLFFTPVPLTLQTFAVLLLGLLLSPRLAAGTMAAYLAEGALGLPVFAPTTGLTGMAHLLGPTGGYLLAYPAAAALTAILWRRTSRGFTAAAISAAAGSLVILACGALWLGILTHSSLHSVLSFAVTPFIPGDLLKITAAAFVAGGLRRFRRSHP